jgi:AcrR family transcriptional regulator
MPHDGKTSTPAPVRRGGRPRATPAVGPDVDTREEILEAAGRLFTTLGYSASSTRQIADAVGLRQASIFHYFARKEDMLAELLDRTVEPALRYVRVLGAEHGPSDASLYLLIINDLRSFCGQAVKLGWLYIQPDARAERFREFWDKRDRLREAYRAFIQSGVDEGLFDTDDVELSTSVVFGIVESVTTWFEPDADRSSLDVWEGVASQALRMLLADPGRVEDVRREAARLEDRLPPVPA